MDGLRSVIKQPLSILFSSICSDGLQSNYCPSGTRVFFFKVRRADLCSAVGVIFHQIGKLRLVGVVGNGSPTLKKRVSIFLILKRSHISCIINRITHSYKIEENRIYFIVIILCVIQSKKNNNNSLVH